MTATTATSTLRVANIVRTHNRTQWAHMYDISCGDLPTMSVVIAPTDLEKWLPKMEAAWKKKVKANPDCFRAMLCGEVPGLGGYKWHVPAPSSGFVLADPDCWAHASTLYLLFSRP